MTTEKWFIDMSESLESCGKKFAETTTEFPPHSVIESLAVVAYSDWCKTTGNEFIEHYISSAVDYFRDGVYEQYPDRKIKYNDDPDAPVLKDDEDWRKYQ